GHAVSAGARRTRPDSSFASTAASSSVTLPSTVRPGRLAKLLPCSATAPASRVRVARRAQAKELRAPRRLLVFRSFLRTNTFSWHPCTTRWATLGQQLPIALRLRHCRRPPQHQFRCRCRRFSTRLTRRPVPLRRSSRAQSASSRCWKLSSRRSATKCWSCAATWSKLKPNMVSSCGGFMTSYRALAHRPTRPQARSSAWRTCWTRSVFLRCSTSMLEIASRSLTTNSSRQTRPSSCQIGWTSSSLASATWLAPCSPRPKLKLTSCGRSTSSCLSVSPRSARRTVVLRSTVLMSLLIRCTGAGSAGSASEQSATGSASPTTPSSTRARA
ncbi:unnamed protein product, partial [Prorocentrum cordatum]